MLRASILSSLLMFTLLSCSIPDGSRWHYAWGWASGRYMPPLQFEKLMITRPAEAPLRLQLDRTAEPILVAQITESYLRDTLHAIRRASPMPCGLYRGEIKINSICYRAGAFSFLVSDGVVKALSATEYGGVYGEPVGLPLYRADSNRPFRFPMKSEDASALFGEPEDTDWLFGESPGCGH